MLTLLIKRLDLKTIFCEEDLKQNYLYLLILIDSLFPLCYFFEYLVYGKYNF